MIQTTDPGRLSISGVPDNKKIINSKKAIKIAEEIKRKKIVLLGGSFDILHLGHYEFLKKAKKEGDFLFLLLENDKNIKKRKGKDRPINNQKLRARNLSRVPYVDFIITLPLMTKDSQYDRLVSQISPSVLVAVKNDPNSVHMKREAKKFGISFKEIMERIPNLSSTNLINNGKIN